MLNTIFTPAKLILPLIFSAIFFTMSPNPIFATNYYISNTGSDTNSGTSPDQPWETLTHVNDQSYLPGDTIHFKSGDTWTGTLRTTSAGTLTAPITYTNYAGTCNNTTGAGCPIIDGQGTYIILIQGTPHNHIKNFHLINGSRAIRAQNDRQGNTSHATYIHNILIQNTSRTGIDFGQFIDPEAYKAGELPNITLPVTKLWGSAQDSTIDNVRILDSPNGIIVTSSTTRLQDDPNLARNWKNFTIKNSYIDCNPIDKYIGLTPELSGPGTTPRQHGLGIKINETSTYIYNNTIKNCSNRTGFHGIYYGNAGFINGRIEGNIISGNYSWGIKLSQVQNITVRNNVIHDNGSVGIGTVQGSRNILIENNTLYNNGLLERSGEFQARLDRTAQDLNFEIGWYHNGFLPKSHPLHGALGNITFKNNIIYGSKDNQSLEEFLYHLYDDDFDSPHDGYFYAHNNSYYTQYPSAQWRDDRLGQQQNLITSITNWNAHNQLASNEQYHDPQFIAPTNLDFRISCNSPALGKGAYPTCQEPAGNPPISPITPRSGDTDNNGTIDILDYQILSNAFNSNSDLRPDFNNDGSVNILDYQILSNNFSR